MDERVVFRWESNPYREESYLAVFPDEPALRGRVCYVAFWFVNDHVFFEPFGEMAWGYYYRCTKPIHTKDEIARSCLKAVEDYCDCKFRLCERIAYPRRKSI